MYVCYISSSIHFRRDHSLSHDRLHLTFPHTLDLLAFPVRISNSCSGDSGGETEPPPPDNGERRQR